MFYVDIIIMLIQSFLLSNFMYANRPDEMFQGQTLYSLGQ